VAGFDVIYAIQDVDFDRAQGLHSIPVRVGARRALARARIFHLIAFLLFAALHVLGLFAVGPIFLIGVVFMAALLLYEHSVIGDVEPDTLELQRIDRAFFLANVGVSTSFFLFTLLDRLL
jgi:4-hydroxybenzoate polyprenyltransferase